MTQKGNEFVVPNSSRKLDNIQILEAGPNPGILYSIVDEGTHFNPHFKKSSRTIRMIFEFPLLKQKFLETDTEERPTVVSQEYTFILGENSNLKRFIDGAEGRILQPAEYRNGWNLGQYLGRIFIVEIVNKPNRKDPNIIHNNIDGVKALTDSLRNKYNFDWDNVTRTNPILAFMIDPAGNCFTSEDFTKLPGYLQKKLKESDEGVRFLNNGGRFAERSDFADTQQSAPPPVERKPTSPTPSKYIMLVNDFTYEQYKESGWTDEQLIKQGKMKLKEASKPVAPQGPASPAISSEDDLEDLNVDDNDVPF